jgi:hypothetical protein
MNRYANQKHILFVIVLLLTAVEKDGPVNAQGDFILSKPFRLLYLTIPAKAGIQGWGGAYYTTK